MGRFLIYLAYSSTTTNPSPTYGAGSPGSVSPVHVYDDGFFYDVDFETVEIEHQMLDGSVKKDNLGYYLKALIKLSPEEIRLDYDFLRRWLSAKHKWALTKYQISVSPSVAGFGNFHNTDDDSTNGFVKCRVETELGASVPQLFESGIVLKSEKIYNVPEKPVNVLAEPDGECINIAWGCAGVGSISAWVDRLQKCQNPLYTVFVGDDAGEGFVEMNTVNTRITSVEVGNGEYTVKIRASNGYGYTDSDTSAQIVISTGE